MLPLLNAAGVIDKGVMEDAFVSWRTPAATAAGPDQSGGTAVAGCRNGTGAARHGTAVAGCRNGTAVAGCRNGAALCSCATVISCAINYLVAQLIGCAGGPAWHGAIELRSSE